jgi:hypothetical protein
VTHRCIGNAKGTRAAAHWPPADDRRPLDPQGNSLVASRALWTSNIQGWWRFGQDVDEFSCRSGTQRRRRLRGVSAWLVQVRSCGGARRYGCRHSVRQKRPGSPGALWLGAWLERNASVVKRTLPISARAPLSLAALGLLGGARVVERESKWNEPRSNEGFRALVKSV